MTGFINFDIIVTKDGEKFKIKSRYGKGGETQSSESGLLTPPEAISPAYQQLLSYVTGKSDQLDRQVAKTAGSFLFRWLFPIEIYGNFNRCVQHASDNGQGIRLRLILEDASLRKLPWEYLFDNVSSNRFVALERDKPIIRYITAGDIPPRQLVRGQAAKLLLVYAVDPADQTAVQKAAAELDQIETVIKAQSDAASRITIYRANQVSFSGLQTALAMYQPDMLHIVAASQSGDDPTLLLYDENGQPDPKTADQIEVLLRGRSQVVVLSAPASQATNDAGLALAEALLKAEVPAVITLQREMPPAVASRFAGQFYHFLSLPMDLDKAITEMRINVNAYDKAAWGLPAMFMRAQDGRLWHEDSPDPAEITVGQTASVPFEHLDSADIYAPLMNLNFHQQVGGFENLIREWRISGCLLRNQSQTPSEDGLKLLLKRLYDKIPQDGQAPLVKKFDNQSWSLGNGPADIWQRLADDFVSAQKMTLENPNGPLTDKDRKAVARLYGGRLSHQNVIFIFDHVDNATIGPLVKQFWEPLVDIIRNPMVPGRYLLLAFFLDNEGAVMAQAAENFIEILAGEQPELAQPREGWLPEHGGRCFALPGVTEFKVKDLDVLKKRLDPRDFDKTIYSMEKKADNRQPDVVIEMLVDSLEYMNRESTSNITFDDWLMNFYIE